MDMDMGIIASSHWELGIGQKAVSLSYAPCAMRHTINVRAQYDCCYKAQFVSFPDESVFSRFAANPLRACLSSVRSEKPAGSVL
jgi:hypothetical protein